MREASGARARSGSRVSGGVGMFLISCDHLQASKGCGMYCVLGVWRREQKVSNWKVYPLLCGVFSRF